MLQLAKGSRAPRPVSVTRRGPSGAPPAAGCREGRSRSRRPPRGPSSACSLPAAAGITARQPPERPGPGLPPPCGQQPPAQPAEPEARRQPQHRVSERPWPKHPLGPLRGTACSGIAALRGRVLAGVLCGLSEVINCNAGQTLLGI